MKLHIIYFFCLLLLIGFANCNTSTDPEKNDKEISITETDEVGNFNGNIDQSDWSDNSYDGIYFAKYFWFKQPKDNKIIFEAKIPGEEVKNSIVFYNHSDAVLKMTSNVNLPFFVNNNNLDLLPHRMHSLQVSFILPDSTNYIFLDTLKLNFLSGENYWISLCTTIPNTDTSIVIFDPISAAKGGIYPAYPNPTNGTLTIPLAIPTSNLTIINVKDQSGNLIKTIINKILPAGFHTILWDLKDDNDKKISPGYYQILFKSGSFIGQGDIKIE